MNPTLWDKLGTALFVTLIATMVWLYAEGRTVSEVTRRVTVRFVAPQGQELMIAQVGSSGNNGASSERIQRFETLEVEVTLDGAQAALSRLDDALNQAVPLQVSAREDATDQIVNLSQLLGRDLLTPMGISINAATPEQVRLHIEPIDTVTDVPVRITDQDGGPLAELILESLEGPPSATPETVSVRLPRSLADAVAESAVIARLIAKDIESSARGQRQQTVPLSLPPEIDAAMAPWVTIQPDVADVSFTVSETRRRWESENPIPIWITAPPSVHDQYRIRLAEDTAATVSFAITGPASAIDELTAFPPIAFVEITSAKAANALAALADGQEAALQAPLRFVLPHGLRQEKVETDLQGPVTLVIQPRTAAEPVAP